MVQATSPNAGQQLPKFATDDQVSSSDTLMEKDDDFGGLIYTPYMLMSALSALTSQIAPYSYDTSHSIQANKACD